MECSTSPTDYSKNAIAQEAVEKDPAISEILDRDVLLGSLLDSLTDLVYVKDTRCRYLLSNAAHIRFLGAAAASDIIGKTAFDFFPAELARKYHADDTRVIETGCEIIEELEPSVGQDGQSKVILRTKRPLRDRQGRIVGLIGVARDVTKRVRAEESLRLMQDTLEMRIKERTAAAEQRARELSFQKFALDQCAIVAVTDACGRITHVNDRFCQISGYTREELIGQDHRMVNSGLQTEEFLKEQYNTIVAGKVWHGEIRNRAKDGSLYWVDATLVPIVDSDGDKKPSGYVAIFQDITQHKQAEENLRQRTHELEAAIDLAERSHHETGFQKFALDQHAIVAATDARGRITYVNDKFCEISKYSRDELVGQDHRIVNSGLHSKEFFKHMYATIAGGNVWHGEIRNRAKDESLYWVDTTIVPIKVEPTGKISGYVAIRADITALKRTQEHLQAAKEAAEAASQSKGEFLANMSHEIRTPMTAIIGYADLLAEADRPVEQRQEFVQTIRRNGEHLLTLINDLLDLSKVEAGKLQLEAIPCNLRQLVAETESCLCPRAQAKGIEFRVECEKHVPRVIESDPTRLRQVLLNLASNAIKFTESGIVRICISWCADSRILKFDVIDTGIGLSSDQQEAIFKPFAQADNSTTRKFGGTGLGLALSKRLVEMLGGQLSLTSERGKGSTFSFTVKDRADDTRHQDRRVTVKRKRREDLSEARACGQRLRGRLLVVEDGADNRRLVTIYLEGAGLTVECAEDGQKALDMVAAAEDRDEQYDLILMDMQMPIMDGYQATSQLRRRGFRKIPIIAFTAHALEGEREKCLDAGCDDYSTKPVNPEALIRTIAKLLKSANTSRRRPKSKIRTDETMNLGKVSSPSGSASETPPPQTIRSLYANNQIVRRVLPGYVADLPKHVASMWAHLQSRRIDDLRRLVHQIRGSGGGYGFPRITELAATAEACITTRSQIDQIEASVRDLCETIRSIEGYQRAKENIAA